MPFSGHALLEKLLSTPSPSGYEQAVQKVVREFAEEFADEITTDVHGNVIAAKNPEGTPRVMLAGHCDQIGMLVTHIDDSGFIYAQTIGGWDAQQLVGQRMVIWTDSGPVPAVIARKPIHLLTDAERKQELEAALQREYVEKESEESRLLKNRLRKIVQPGRFGLTGE